MLPPLYKAMDTLERQGIDLQLVDTFRYYNVQDESYKAAVGTPKEGLVAHPDDSYHVKGIGFDLRQHESMNTPEVIEALEEVGFIRSRVDDEPYHWSMDDEKALALGLVSQKQFDEQSEYRK